MWHVRPGTGWSLLTVDSLACSFGISPARINLLVMLEEFQKKTVHKRTQPRLTNTNVFSCLIWPFLISKIEKVASYSHRHPKVVIAYNRWVPWFVKKWSSIEAPPGQNNEGDFQLTPFCFHHFLGGDLSEKTPKKVLVFFAQKKNTAGSRLFGRFAKTKSELRALVLEDPQSLEVTIPTWHEFGSLFFSPSPKWSRSKNCQVDF